MITLLSRVESHLWLAKKARYTDTSREQLRSWRSTLSDIMLSGVDVPTIAAVVCTNAGAMG